MHTNDTQQPYGRAKRRRSNSRRIHTGLTCMVYGVLCYMSGAMVDAYLGKTMAGLCMWYGLSTVGGAIALFGAYRWFVGVSNIALYITELHGAPAEHHEA